MSAFPKMKTTSTGIHMYVHMYVVASPSSSLNDAQSQLGAMKLQAKAPASNEGKLKKKQFPYVYAAGRGTLPLVVQQMHLVCVYGFR